MVEFIPVEIVHKIISHLFIKKETMFRFVYLGNYVLKIPYQVNVQSKIDVSTAKNFRLVCKDIADAYCPQFIHINIGGSLFRRQYISLLIHNGRLSTPYLKPLHAQVLLSKYEEQGYFYNATYIDEYIIYDAKKFTHKNVLSIGSDVMKILDNDFMSQLTKDSKKYTQSLSFREPIEFDFVKSLDFRSLYPSILLSLYDI